MRQLLSLEWELVRKRHIIELTVIAALIIALLYQLAYYSNVTVSSNIGNFINSFFFQDGDKNLFLYFMLVFLPIFSTSFYSWHVIDDRKSIMNLGIRSNKKNILYAKVIINFLIGFIFCFVLISSIAIFTLLILWNKTGDYNFLNIGRLSADTIMQFGAKSDVASTTLGYLFFRNPYLYYFIYILILSIYSGIQSIIATLFAYFTNKKIIVILSAFAIHFIIGGALVQLVLPFPLNDYAIFEALAPITTVCNSSYVPYVWIGYLIVVSIAINRVIHYICKDDYLYGKS